MPEIKLTREDLYERVWSQPTSLIAPEFGISDVALAKICKKLNVPKPPRGYWQKIEVGDKPRRAPLPKATIKTPSHVTTSLRSGPVRFQVTNADTLARIRAECDPTNRISVRETLRSCHPLVQASRTAIESSRVDDYGRLVGSVEHLDVRVSRDALRRALLIADALLRALEHRGGAVEIETRSWPGTKIVLGKQRVTIHLIEKVTRRENSAPRKSAYDWGWRQWLYEPTGELSLVIEEYSSFAFRKTWRDLKGRPLEDQLNDVVVGIWTAAEAKRVEAAARQLEEERRIEAERRRAEESRLREKEAERRRELEPQ